MTIGDREINAPDYIGGNPYGLNAQLLKETIKAAKAQGVPVSYQHIDLEYSPHSPINVLQGFMKFMEG